MAIDRRGFFGLAGGLFGFALPLPVGARALGLFAAARREESGAYSAAIFTADGTDIACADLPARGHGLAVCPRSGRCVVFARRPGTFAVSLPLAGGAEPYKFQAPDDRHFYGHGVFSGDGRLLYATENDFEAGRGVIGVYDATASFRRVGEFPTHGVGPHDLALIDARTMVIVNGGLREHPDIGAGRRILNLDAIATSLAYVDTATGDLLERHDIKAGAALSLRHLAVGRDGTVVLGAQVIDGAPGAALAEASLIYRHRRQSPLGATRFVRDVESRLAGYVSSVAVDAAGEIAAVTSSRGASVLAFEVATGRALGVTKLDDVSGIAASARPGAFLATSGHGAIVGAMQPGVRAGDAARSDWQWDNHAIRVG